MYSFRDTVAGSSSEDIGSLPTSAMMYNGRYIENVIDGYQTLTVTGREMISLDIDSDSIKVGALISMQRIQPRILTVQYKLEDNNPEELQKKFKELMILLFKEEDVEISFKDEPGIKYYGRYSETDDVPGDTNSIFSSFTIYCQDPRKYSNSKQSGAKITMHSPVETPPEKIVVKLARGNSIKITNQNTKKQIRVTGAAIYSNDVLTFDMDQGILLVNGKDMTSIFDIESDFENFYIHRGDVLTCDNGQMTIYAREVYL